MEKLRIVHNVVRITPERQEQLIAAAREKAAGAAAAAKPSGDPVAQT